MLRDQATLLDIVRFAEEILDLTKEMDEMIFASSRSTQLAVLYEIAVLGEAVKRLSSEFREEHPEIPWKEIAGMRDKVIHQYDRVKIPVVWQVVIVDIPGLLDQLKPYITGRNLTEENLKMTEPLTTGLLVTLAVQEFIKSGTGDLAKRFTAEALAKIPVLWEKIKTRLMGRSAKVNEAIAKVEGGDSKAVETLTKNLDVILDEDPDFAKELKVLAQTIQAGKIQDNSSMIQNNADNAKGWQTKVEGGTAYIGEIHINQGQQPKT